MHMINGSSGETYAFIAVDTTLNPGPKRPYNFIGMLTQNETNRIEQLIQQSYNAGVNYTIWFGHYPTSCIVTKNNESRTLVNIISSCSTSLAYMCGHFHTLGGLVHEMYSLHNEKFLELEVGDFKDNHRYRVAAIDHGLLSFVDVEHDSWPIILITNPKHALFRIPNRHEAQTQLGGSKSNIFSF